jgi:hypothetical protein
MPIFMPLFSLRRNSAPRSGLHLFNLPRLVCQSVRECVPVDDNAPKAPVIIGVLGGSV